MVVKLWISKRQRQGEQHVWQQSAKQFAVHKVEQRQKRQQSK
jgi:hypothetical protein